MPDNLNFAITAPFSDWPRSVQAVVCAVLVVASLWFGRYLKEQGQPIEERLPYGVLTPEAPGSSANAQRIIDWLSVEGIAAARRQTRLDSVFLVLYALALSLACTLIAEASVGPLRAIGVMVAWVALAAVALDAIENLAMLRMLSSATAAPWPQLSTACASLKFTIALGALAYIVIGLAWLAHGWWSGR